MPNWLAKGRRGPNCPGCGEEMREVEERTPFSPTFFYVCSECNQELPVPEEEVENLSFFAEPSPMEIAGPAEVVLA